LWWSQCCQARDFQERLQWWVLIQFFSTVHFHEDDVKTRTWMSVGERCIHTLAQFGVLLAYEVKDPRDPDYRRIHSPKNS
jgi:hypothetical protein